VQKGGIADENSCTGQTRPGSARCSAREAYVSPWRLQAVEGEREHAHRVGDGEVEAPWRPRRDECAASPAKKQATGCIRLETKCGVREIPL